MILQPEILTQRLADLPNKPGIYLMKNADGEIIYVGKAAVLRNRVRSYFQAPEGLAPRTRSMVSHVADLEYIVTKSELEALLLESNYIKQYQPRYNVRLRDDKQYAYIRITLQEDFPRVQRVRQIAKDGARYFGPYANSKAIGETLSLIKRLFPYRSCDLALVAGAIDPTFRPCLELHINRCVGPCNGTSSQEEYRATIDQVCLFLEGRQEQVLRQLERQMEAAADAMQFEVAARIRDQIAAVGRVIERQRAVSIGQEDQDALGLARDTSGACIELMQARQGKIVGSDHFLVDAAPDTSDAEVLAAFLLQYYDKAAELPPQILLPAEPDDRPTIEQWLRSMERGKPHLVVPKRGGKRDVVAMATENAQQALGEERAHWLASKQRTVEAAGALGAALALPRFPHRIECYDNSNIQGSNPVAAMVVFVDGQPAKAEYRKFKIKTVEGADDFRSMSEVLRRRFSRALRGEHSGNATASEEAPDTGWAALPDLVIVDGGKGQLSAAVTTFTELDLLERVPLVALAKQQEELFLPGQDDPVVLPRTSAALHLVQRIRDETHRFAITFHRQQRQRSGLSSSLDTVTGIGPKRRQALVRRFGSPRGVMEASVEELTAVPGITTALAQRLKLSLGYG
ncbi:MAG TPA: excinuclease ABC subunit UvrC [Chloroflexota bacterium]|nr:excinuclease ABC subunit UvrC [Chloroflexota bacterium]